MNKKIIFLIIALTVTFSNKGLSFERGVGDAANLLI